MASLSVNLPGGAPSSYKAPEQERELNPYIDPEWATLDPKAKIALLLETPAGLWQPDGVDAAQGRLEALEQEEEKAAGLEDDEVDDRLWPGAYQQGWRVYIKGKRNDGHYWYVTPTGRRLGSKTEAMCMGVPRQKSGRRERQDYSNDGEDSAMQRDDDDDDWKPS